MRIFGLAGLAAVSFIGNALAQPGTPPAAATPTVQSLEGVWRIARLVSLFETANGNPAELVGRTITVKDGRLRGDGSCRWDEEAVTDRDLASDAATRARFARQKIISQGRGVHEFTWMCGNAMGVTFIIVPGQTSATYLRDRRGIYEVAAVTANAVPPTSNTAPDVKSVDAELRRKADHGDAGSADQLADLARQRGNADDEQKYKIMAEASRFAVLATALPSGRSLGRPASGAEPSFEDLRAAIRDMESCRLLLGRGDRFNLPWDGAQGGSRRDYNAAVTALRGHGEFRPEFSIAQRQALRGLWWRLSERVEAAFPTAAGIPEAIQRCKARFNELRPMFKSYTMNPALREKCINAYAEGNFLQQMRWYSATKFDLFAVFPTGVSNEPVVARPDRVQMRFAFLKARATQDGPQVVPYWDYYDLPGGCSTKL